MATNTTVATIWIMLITAVSTRVRLVCAATRPTNPYIPKELIKSYHDNEMMLAVLRIDNIKW